MTDYIIGGIYRHFKGNLYRLKCVATDTETGKETAVYESLKDGKLWCRPLEMFLSPVDREQYPYAAQEQRFELAKVCANCFWNNKFDDGTSACGLSFVFVKPLESCEEFVSENDVERKEKNVSLLL